MRDAREAAIDIPIGMGWRLGGGTEGGVERERERGTERREATQCWAGAGSAAFMLKMLQRSATGT